MSYPEPLRTQVEELLSFFEFSQLPVFLQAESRPFHEHAHRLARETMWSYELVACLRALVIAKDSAVRARVLHRRQHPDPEPVHG